MSSLPSDLGEPCDLDLEEPPCVFLPATLDTPSSAASHHNSGSSIIGEITDKSAWEAGKGLAKEDIVSLAFLLVSDPGNALQICREVRRTYNVQSKSHDLQVARVLPCLFLQVLRGELGTRPKEMGSYFLFTLVFNMKKKNLPKMDVKVVCAMHLINKYKGIEKLVGMCKSEALRTFQGREYVYIDPLRVGLFKLAYRQNSEERLKFMANVSKELDCQPRMGSEIPADCLEVGMLELMINRRLYAGEPLARLAKHLPKDRKLKQVEVRE